MDLLPHQVEGVEWCMDMEKQGKSGFLCDDMGLGKTVQMCALVSKTIKENGGSGHPVLVCSLLNNTTHWFNEFKRYDTDIITFNPPRKYDGNIPKEVHVVIVPYSYFQRNNPIWIFDTEWERVIFDEAHTAANPKTKLHKALATINAKYRWALTATPMQNKKNEIMAIASGILKINGINGVDDVIANHYLRRTSDVDEDKLPPLNAIIQVRVGVAAPNDAFTRCL